MASVIHLAGRFFINFTSNGAQESGDSKKFSFSIVLEYRHCQFYTLGSVDLIIILA